MREKWPYSGFFWSAFSRIRTEYGEIRSLRIQSECWKMRIRITPNKDTFYSVKASFRGKLFDEHATEWKILAFKYFFREMVELKQKLYFFLFFHALFSTVEHLWRVGECSIVADWVAEENFRRGFHKWLGKEGGNDDHDDDDNELFLWNGCPTKVRKALYPAGTIARCCHY